MLASATMQVRHLALCVGTTAAKMCGDRLSVCRRTAQITGCFQVLPASKLLDGALLLAALKSKVPVHAQLQALPKITPCVPSLTHAQHFLPHNVCM
jgi:hypothetical protein